MKHIVLSFSLTISFIFTTPAFCQETVSSADTLSNKPKWHQTKAFRALAMPSLLAGYGIFTANNKGYLYTSYEVYRDIRQHLPNFRTRIDDFTTVIPGIAVYGLNLAGVKGKHNFKDRTLIYGLSGTLALGTGLGLKGTINRLRPDSTTYNSFPSGHTIAAFVSAEFMHQEFKNESIWYSIAGYSMAAATGAMRMLNNRHWLSDVLVGGAIGMFTTKVVYLVYPWIDERINTGKHLDIGFIPAFYGRGAGLVMICIIK